MRITAQLIDADSDSQLWSETCDREMKVDSDLDPLHDNPCFTRVLQRLGRTTQSLLALCTWHCDAELFTVPDMPRLDFQLDHDFIELNQLLKLAGLCDSGGAGKALVASGAVRVDGVVETRKTCKIRAGQQVEMGEACIHVSG